jgi:hypothetical protein
MENVINVKMSCFWINKENPSLISYNPENTSEWIPIQSECYHYGIDKPKQDEISYMHKGNKYYGYLLKLIDEKN